MKQIIEGVTYNTDTAYLLAGNTYCTTEGRTEVRTSLFLRQTRRTQRYFIQHRKTTIHKGRHWLNTVEEHIEPIPDMGTFFDRLNLMKSEKRSEIAH